MTQRRQKTSRKVGTRSSKATVERLRLQLQQERQRRRDAVKETKEALERQKATADILGVISGSPTKTQPVFDAVVQTAARLFPPCNVVLTIRRGNFLYGVARAGWRLSKRQVQRLEKLYPLPLDTKVLPSGRAIHERRIIEIPDNLAPGLSVTTRRMGRIAGYRSLTIVPMLQRGEGIGTINLTWAEPGCRLTEKQLELVRAFADQAVIAIQNARLFRETKEALEHQKASADILKIVASSVESPAPVFEAIVAAGRRLLPEFRIGLNLLRDGKLHYVAHAGITPARRAQLAKLFPIPVDRQGVIGTAVLTKQVVAVPDVRAKRMPYKRSLRTSRVSGWRAMLAVPLIRDGNAIGVLSVARATPGPFTDKQIGVARTFADQAVIALQNARLFNETKEALEQQTATAEILKVISSSPTDEQPVFEAIVNSTARLFGRTARIRLLRGNELHLRARSEGGSQSVGTLALPLTPESIQGRVALARKALQIADTQDPHTPGANVTTSTVVGYRAVALAPLIRENTLLGTLGVSSSVPGALSDKEMALLQTFADQAVIAIENVRLFKELEARNKALGESLDQQTATAEILKVISSSPTDIQPVLDAVASTAARLCGATNAVIRRVDGQLLRLAAIHGAMPTDSKARPIDRGSAAGRAVIDRKTIHISGVEDDAELTFTREIAGQHGFRTVLSTPLLREGQPIGTISIRRPEARPFSDSEVKLLETFAHQAVLAIENVRLFNETKESLEQQTAISEVLRVISNSPSDVKPVLDAVATRAARICEATDAIIFMREGEHIRLVTHLGDIAYGTGLGLGGTTSITRDMAAGRAILDGVPVHLEDIYAVPPEEWRKALDLQAGSRHRSILAVPLMRESRALGSIVLRRMEVRAFTEKQIALLKVFADQAAIAIENVRLFNETKEALEQQTATSEILGVISSTPTDVQPVFDAIVQATQRLIGGKRAALLLRQGTNFAMVAHSSMGSQLGDEDRLGVPLDRDKNYPSRAILDGEVIHVTDWEAEDVPEFERYIARSRGIKSGVMVPLMRRGEGIGALAVARETTGPYHEKEIALLRSFADQAVIAIENTRLFNETKDALERQTATSEILGVISSSPTDVQPVFGAIARNARRLCDAVFCNVVRYDGEQLHAVAIEGDVEFRRAVLARYPMRPSPSQLSGRVIEERKVLRIRDAQADEHYDRDYAARGGFRRMLAVPMMKEGAVLGSIIVAWREAGDTPDAQAELLRTFTEQAVIAIENVRLFNETKEALEQQTASSDVLRVISRSVADTKPVFQAILQSCGRLFQGFYVGINLVGDDGLVHLGDFYGPGRTEFESMFPLPIDMNSGSGLAILTRSVGHYPDTLGDPDTPLVVRRASEVQGVKSAIMAPMLKEDRAVGVIYVGRNFAGPFSEKEIALLKTFADQAVIAIENVRLFREVEARSKDLGESLEQQTAMTRILGVMSSSHTDVQPVLDAVAESAALLCETDDAIIRRVESGGLRRVAHYGPLPESEETKIHPLVMGSVGGRAVLECRAIHIEDTEVTFQDEGYAQARFLWATAGKYRTMLAMPLVREGVAIGVIMCRRREMRPFTERQIGLLRTFADQAVIAIENVRLFNETRDALDRQTATSEVLTAISGAQKDASPVFKTIARNAHLLSGAVYCNVLHFDGKMLHVAAIDGFSPEHEKEMSRAYPAEPGEAAMSGRVVLSGKVEHIEDVLVDPFYDKKHAAILGLRRMLGVPMIRDGAVLGVIVLGWKEAGQTPDVLVEMLKTFADQAVIAIENVRLFREIQEKSRQLEEASQHKSQFLASMSHELRTPLNAILGFNEMILGQVYGEVPGDMQPPLTQMQSSGKHLLRLINNVLDLAKIEAGRMDLALAEYSVHDTVESVRSTLQPLATDKGLQLLTAVPQDIPLAFGDSGRITQCLMNLAGNSLKFTKAGKVEISVLMNNGHLRYRVADTGVGIPPDKIDGLFTEFKQTDATIASEYGGTGLGLSISRKFVEMHGGRIWVESEPGRGSTFTFEIPLRAREGSSA